MTDPEIMRRLAALERAIGRDKIIEKTGYSGPTTYLPTYLGGTTPGVTTYTFQDGGYIRIGALIFVRGQLSWSAVTGTGNAQISLPITAAGGNMSGSLYLTGITFAAGTPQMLITPGNDFFTMGSPATNAAPTVVQMEAAGQVIFTAVYVA